MHRRSLLAGLSAVGFTAQRASAQAAFFELPRDQDPMSLMSGDAVFTEGPFAGNILAGTFGHVSALDTVVTTQFQTADGKLGFSDLKGKTVVVALWAEWCPPCLRELAELAALKQRINDPRFDVIALLTASSARLDFASARRMIDEAVTDPVELWIEPRGGHTVFDAYCDPVPQASFPARRSIPNLLLFAPSGRLEARMIGTRSIPGRVEGPRTPPPEGGTAVIRDSVEVRKMKPGEAMEATIWSEPDIADVFVRGLLDRANA